MPALGVDRFYDHDELTAYVHAWRDERPQLVEVESIGRSREGRDIWLVTLTNRETGPPLEKPAFLVDANIHAVEWTASVAALHLIGRLARDHGADERVTRLLDTRCVYVVPRLSPDGAEHSLREGRYIRSNLRRHPRAERGPGLLMGDVDGDGRTLFMRVRDRNGPWKSHPDEPRLLVRRAPDEAGGEYYRVFPEGDVAGWDGATVAEADLLEGIDLHASYPANFLVRGKDARTGDYPGGEPELRAYLDAVVARPNVTGHVTCHTFGGVILHPPSEADDDVPAFDAEIFATLGARGAELTGYPAIAYDDLKPVPRTPGRDGAFDWFYEHRGVVTFLTELWSPWRAAGLGPPDRASGWLGGDHPLDDELALLRWSDEELGGAGYVDWYPFDHPQLGPVELGGWDTIHYWYNPPLDRLEREVAPHTEWVVHLALASPLLGVRSLEAEQVGDGVYRIRLVVENTGWLPTYVTKKALAGYLAGPVTAELELPRGARLLSGDAVAELGQLEGRVEQRSTATWWGYRPGTEDWALVQWLLAAPAGTTVRAVARHPRAGSVRVEVTL